MTTEFGRPRDPRIVGAVLKATVDLLGETGYADLSVDAIAKRAGTSKPAIYRRWPSKAHLVHEAVFPIGEATALPDTGSLAGDVRAMVRLGQQGPGRVRSQGLRPIGADLSYGMLAGRTQDDVPNEADEVFVSALANGYVYIAYGSIKPKVQVPACLDVRTEYNKKADKATNDLQFHRIDQKAYDKLGDLRQQGAEAFKRCFAQRAPQQPSFAEATRQAQALLAEAMGK